MICDKTVIIQVRNANLDARNKFESSNAIALKHSDRLSTHRSSLTLVVSPRRWRCPGASTLYALKCIENIRAACDYDTMLRSACNSTSVEYEVRVIPLPPKRKNIRRLANKYKYAVKYNYKHNDLTICCWFFILIIKRNKTQNKPHIYYVDIIETPCRDARLDMK